MPCSGLGLALIFHRRLSHSALDRRSFVLILSVREPVD